MAGENDPTPWLTVPQAAARAQVGRLVIYRAVKGGKLKAVKVAGKLRLHITWVDAWLETAAALAVINPEAPGPALVYRGR